MKSRGRAGRGLRGRGTQTQTPWVAQSPADAASLSFNREGTLPRFCSGQQPAPSSSGIWAPPGAGGWAQGPVCPRDGLQALPGLQVQTVTGPAAPAAPTATSLKPLGRWRSSCPETLQRRAQQGAVTGQRQASEQVTSSVKWAKQQHFPHGCSHQTSNYGQTLRADLAQ